MNERIRELALEARIAYYSKNGSYEGSDDGLSVIPSTQSLEKFAQLIVRECLVQIVDAIPDTNCSASGAYKTAKIAATSRVKEHFGVE